MQHRTDQVTIPTLLDITGMTEAKIGLTRSMFQRYYTLTALRQHRTDQVTVPTSCNVTGMRPKWD